MCLEYVKMSVKWPSTEDGGCLKGGEVDAPATRREMHELLSTKEFADAAVAVYAAEGELHIERLTESVAVVMDGGLLPLFHNQILEHE